MLWAWREKVMGPRIDTTAQGVEAQNVVTKFPPVEVASILPLRRC